MRIRTLFMFVAAAALVVPAFAGSRSDHAKRGGPFHLSANGVSWDDESDDEGSDSDPTVCERSANTMFTSCGFEIKEEFNATVAACINFGDAAVRKACLAGAKAAKAENAQNCYDVREARIDACDLLGEDRYDPEPLRDPSIDFIDPDEIGDSEGPNPYFSLGAGHTYVLRAGEGFEETIVVTVTDDVREVLGVDCRIVIDIVVLEDDGEFEAVEVTDDYYAQSTERDIYYCGEVARNFEEGRLDNLDGSFEAGYDLAKSGVLIKADPVPNDAHRQEFKLGEAEDIIRYVGTAEAPGGDEGGENPIADFDCSLNGGCVKTEEFIPPDPSSGEYKYFLAGTGFVLGVALEDGLPTGDRDELICVGDSLDVLADPSCGISDPEALLDELCRLSPYFCDGD